MAGLSIKQEDTSEINDGEMYCYPDSNRGTPYIACIGSNFEASRNGDGTQVEIMNKEKNCDSPVVFTSHIIHKTTHVQLENHDFPVHIKTEPPDNFDQNEIDSDSLTDLYDTNKFCNPEMANNIKIENVMEEGTNSSLPLSRKAPFIFPSSSVSNMTSDSDEITNMVADEPKHLLQVGDNKKQDSCDNKKKRARSNSGKADNLSEPLGSCNYQDKIIPTQDKRRVQKQQGLQNTVFQQIDMQQKRKQMTQEYDKIIKKSTKKTKALFQQGAELNEVKVKRLDKIIQEVRFNLELDDKFPKSKPAKEKNDVDEQKNSSLTEESDHFDISDEEMDDDDELHGHGEGEEIETHEITGINSMQSPSNMDSIWSKEIKAPTGEHRYHCSACNKGFYYMSHLRKHYLIHLHIKPYKCTTCGKCFHQNSNLKTHMRTHADEKAFNCTLCNKGFNHNASLQIHLRTHTGERPYICDFCGKGFSRKNTLKVHEITHSEDKPYACTECGKKFGRRYVLQRHVLTHTGEKPYKCKTCGRDFAQSGDLHKHERIHTGEKPYICSTCGKGFCQNGDLQKHTKIHLKEKRTYACPNCDQVFTNKNKLRDHLKTHKEKLLFVCTVCNEEFSEVDKFQIHRKTHETPMLSNPLNLSSSETIKVKSEPESDEENHSRDRRIKENAETITAYSNVGNIENVKETSTINKESIKNETNSGDESKVLVPLELEDTDKVHSCYMCGLVFDTREELKDHTTTHQAELPFICPTCGKGYRQKGLLQAHIRTHTGETPFSCRECGKCFRLNRDLKRHEQIHTGIRPFICKVCNRGFRWNWDLRKHLRIHSDERPFVCETCGKGFRQNCILKSHMKTHTGEKPYVCNICSKGLTKSTDLMRHMRIHTGEKSYFCPVCQKAFGYKYNVQKHLETHVKKGQIDMESFKNYCKNITKSNV